MDGEAYRLVEYFPTYRVGLRENRNEFQSHFMYAPHKTGLLGRQNHSLQTLPSGMEPH
jgi:hypothetical protein